MRRASAAGEASLKTRPADGRDVEIGRLKAKVGDLTMANELLEVKIAHLASALPVDFQDHVPARVQQFTGGVTVRSVEIAEDFCVFEKLLIRNALAEGCLIGEMVVPAIDFTRARRPGGEGHGNHHVFLALDQRVYQAGLAGTRGRGDNEQRAASRPGLIRHSGPARASAR